MSPASKFLLFKKQLSYPRGRSRRISTFEASPGKVRETLSQKQNKNRKTRSTIPSHRGGKN
jgi:hypothetical protein